MVDPVCLLRYQSSSRAPEKRELAAMAQTAQVISWRRMQRKQMDEIKSTRVQGGGVS